MHGWLAGDWPSMGRSQHYCSGQWWRSGDITRTQNVSEYMLVLALCLVCNLQTRLFNFMSVPNRTWRCPPGRPRNKCLNQLRDDSDRSIEDLWRRAVSHGHSGARGRNHVFNVGGPILGISYCTEQNTDGIPSFVHCSLLRNGNHTLHQKVGVVRPNFGGLDPPTPQ